MRVIRSIPHLPASKIFSKGYEVICQCDRLNENKSNMKRAIQIWLSCTVLLSTFLSACSQTETTNLFNGTDLSGWDVDVPAADNNPAISPSFIVRNGMLVSLGKPEGHLVTQKEFENYRLEV